MTRLGIAVLCALLQSQAALAQSLGQGADDGVSTWRVVAAFLFCIAVALAGAFILKARMGGSAQFLPLAMKRNRRLQVIESLRLGPQTGLCIVLCDGRELLVSTSEKGVHLLDRLPSAAERA